MFVSYGAYRPHAEDLFGSTVKKVAQAVLENPFLVVEPPGQELAVAGFYQGIVEEDNAANIVTWRDVQNCVTIMTNWELGGGQKETFVGSLVTYFALHDKPTMKRLKNIWGNYKFLFSFRKLGKSPEYVNRIPYNSPKNFEVLQYSWVWQPIDEIRDYCAISVWHSAPTSPYGRS
jgi:hypothetical protein